MRLFHGTQGRNGKGPSPNPDDEMNIMDEKMGFVQVKLPKYMH